MITAQVQKRIGPDFLLDVAFTLPAQQTLAVLGHNGSGKTTLLDLLAGLRRPDAGRVALNGRVVYDAARGINVPARARHLGYIFQHYALFPHLTVRDNVRCGLRGQPQRLEELLRQFRLEALADRYPRQLSGGEQQRLALARSLASHPAVLLLDEPFSALDPPWRRELRQEFRSLRAQFNLTAVLVTHDPGEALELGDAVLVLEQGKVAQHGSADQVMWQPASPYVAAITGNPNLFTSQVLEVEGDTMVLQAYGTRITASGVVASPGRTVAWTVRPEAVMILRPGRPLAAPVQENHLQGVLTSTAKEIDGHSFTVAVPRWPPIVGRVPHTTWERLMADTGQAVTVSLKRSATWVMGRQEAP
ncbi:MAG: ABC transporter ATP-binding protein [Deinococcus sp.]|nr:ABC transporter ATP-binding protein [Deinococcus sp.]